MKIGNKLIIDDGYLKYCVSATYYNSIPSTINIRLFINIKSTIYDRLYLRLWRAYLILNENRK